MEPVLPKTPSANRGDLLHLIRRHSTDREVWDYFIQKGYGREAIRYILEYEGIYFPHAV